MTSPGSAGIPPFHALPQSKQSSQHHNNGIFLLSALFKGGIGFSCVWESKVMGLRCSKEQMLQGRQIRSHQELQFEVGLQSLHPPPVPPILTLTAAKFIGLYKYHFTPMMFLFHVPIPWTGEAALTGLKENSGPTFPPLLLPPALHMQALAGN